MMDRLEKGSGQTVVTLQEAKSLLKEDDDLIIAVYDYWLNKRLKTVSYFLEISLSEGS
jgi:enhancer of polycomb-like protein